MFTNTQFISTTVLAVENRHEDYENDPFALGDSDVEEKPGLVIDQSDEGDEDVEVD